jgi:hypothetical protein
VALGHFCSNTLVRLVARTGHPEVMLVVGLGLCFTLAFIAERVGLADIIGAFAAGLLLDPYGTGVRTRKNSSGGIIRDLHWQRPPLHHQQRQARTLRDEKCVPLYTPMFTGVKGIMWHSWWLENPLKSHGIRRIRQVRHPFPVNTLP